MPHASYRTRTGGFGLSRASLLAAGAMLMGLLTAQPAKAFEPYYNATVGGVLSPGVYGQVTIGNMPPPPVLFPQPVIVRPAAVLPPPLYMYVPPGHAKKWGKHCHKYDACGRPVYFVKEEWVQARYAEAHPGKGPPVHARGHGKGRGKDD